MDVKQGFEDYDKFYDEFQEKMESRTEPMPNPSRLRAYINRVLRETDVKISELIKVSPAGDVPFRKFMKNDYKDKVWGSMQSSGYDAAAYFVFREKKLGKNAVIKIRKSTVCDGTSGSAGKQQLPDLSDIVIEGAEHTWQTPEEVRKELNKILSAYQTSVPKLAEVMSAPYQSLSKFLKQVGVFGGKDNAAYHPAALFVEKLRIALGKPKSKKRLGLEEEVVAMGLDEPFLGQDPKARVLCFGNERPHLVKDHLGRYGMNYF